MSDPSLARLAGAVSILQPVAAMLEEILHMLTPSHVAACPDSKQSTWPEPLPELLAKRHHK